LLSLRVLIAGYRKFHAIVLTSHSMQLGFTIFQSLPFYVQVLATWVSLPMVLFAVLGMLRKNYRTDSELFAVCWFVVPFLFLSSLPSAYHRAMIPLLPPVALLSAIGIKKTIIILKRVLVPKHRVSIDLTNLLQLGIVVLILALSVTPTLGAVSDVHSGYRQAGIMLNAVAGNSPVYCYCSPVITFYHSAVLPVTSEALNSSNLPTQGFIVTDYTTYVRGYLTPTSEQTLESEGRLRLVASIPSGIPQPAYLGDYSFTQLQELNSTFTYIRIYEITNSTSG
jgi:hypothetical protein